VEVGATVVLVVVVVVVAAVVVVLDVVDGTVVVVTALVDVDGAVVDTEDGIASVDGDAVVSGESPDVVLVEHAPSVRAPTMATARRRRTAGRCEWRSVVISRPPGRRDRD